MTMTDARARPEYITHRGSRDLRMNTVPGSTRILIRILMLLSVAAATATDDNAATTRQRWSNGTIAEGVVRCWDVENWRGGAASSIRTSWVLDCDSARLDELTRGAPANASDGEAATGRAALEARRMHRHVGVAYASDRTGRRRE